MRLEFWRSARSLHGMARQAASLARQAAAPGAFALLSLRFEVRCCAALPRVLVRQWAGGLERCARVHGMRALGMRPAAA